MHLSQHIKYISSLHSLIKVFRSLDKYNRLHVIMFKFMAEKRNQQRKQLIEFFMTISQSQNQIQKKQDKLISHLKFNALSLYQKITRGSDQMKPFYLKRYIAKHIKIEDEKSIEFYLQKHHLHSLSIELPQFIQTLLPYNPTTLRKANQNLHKHSPPKHLDQDIEFLYQQLLQTEIEAIFRVRMLQHGINLKWKQIKTSILKDLQVKGKKIDSSITQQISIINIRKWMQLWIEVNEYDILNLMRWFDGWEEISIEKSFKLLKGSVNLKGPVDKAINQSDKNQNQRKINHSAKHQPEQKLKAVKSEKALHLDRLERQMKHFRSKDKKQHHSPSFSMQKQSLSKI